MSSSPERQPVVAWQSSRLLTSADLLQERKVHYCLTKALGIELTCSTSLGWQRGPFRLVNFSRAWLDCLPGLVGSKQKAGPKQGNLLRWNFCSMLLGILVFIIKGCSPMWFLRNFHGSWRIWEMQSSVIRGNKTNTTGINLKAQTSCRGSRAVKGSLQT